MLHQLGIFAVWNVLSGGAEGHHTPCTQQRGHRPLDRGHGYAICANRVRANDRELRASVESLSRPPPVIVCMSHAGASTPLTGGSRQDSSWKKVGGKQFFSSFVIHQ